MNGSKFNLIFFRLPREARRLTAAITFALVLFIITILANLWSLMVIKLTEIEASEPRIARLKGYQAAQTDISRASDVASLALKDLVFSSDKDQSQVGAQLQQTLRAFAADAGLTVKGSQLVRDVNRDAISDDFVLLAVELSMSGLPTALQFFLEEVYEYRPKLKVSQLNMVKARTRRSTKRRNQVSSIEQQTLNFDIQIVAVMVAE